MCNAAAIRQCPQCCETVPSGQSLSGTVTSTSLGYEDLAPCPQLMPGTPTKTSISPFCFMKVLCNGIISHRSTTTTTTPTKQTTVKSNKKTGTTTGGSFMPLESVPSGSGRGTSLVDTNIAGTFTKTVSG